MSITDHPIIHWIRAKLHEFGEIKALCQAMNTLQITNRVGQTIYSKLALDKVIIGAGICHIRAACLAKLYFRLEPANGSFTLNNITLGMQSQGVQRMRSQHGQQNGGFNIFKVKHVLSVLVVTERPYQAIVVLGLRIGGRQNSYSGGNSPNSTFLNGSADPKIL